MTQNANTNTQEEYDTRAIAQAEEITRRIEHLNAKAEYRGAMIWISGATKNTITNTLLMVIKDMGYRLNSVTMHEGKVYAFFFVNEDKI